MESEKKTLKAKWGDNTEREVFIMQCVEENGKLEQRILLIGNRISLFLKQWFSTRDDCALLQADIQQNVRTFLKGSYLFILKHTILWF